LSLPANTMNNCVPYNSGSARWPPHPPQLSYPQFCHSDQTNPGWIPYQPFPIVQPQIRPNLHHQPPKFYSRPVERHVRDRIATLEHRKNASLMESRTEASAREENSHNSKELEVYLKNAAYQLNELKSEIARVESLLETRNNLQEQTRDSNDETRNSLERILNLLGEMGVKQDRVLAAQDQTCSRISHIEEMVGNMDMLLNNILKLLAPQGHALKATAPGPSIYRSPSERKGSGRRSSTTIRKRKMVLNKVLPKNEQAADGTRRRSSRLASKWSAETSAQSVMF
jgi:hypothetical protein